MTSVGKAFPKMGDSWTVLKGRMEAMRRNDVPWQRGRAPLHVYFASEDVNGSISPLEKHAHFLLDLIEQQPDHDSG